MAIRLQIRQLLVKLSRPLHIFADIFYVNITFFELRKSENWVGPESPRVHKSGLEDVTEKLTKLQYKFLYLQENASTMMVCYT